MHAIVIAATAQSAATRVAVRTLRDHHPDASITVLVTDPLASPADIDGAATIPARGLTVGGLRYIDAWLGGGEAFARWAVLPAAVRAAGAAGPVLVVPGHARVYAPLDDLVDRAPVGGIALAARGRHAGADVSFGGWVPELAVIDAGASPVLQWWEELACDALLADDVRATFDLDDPWRSFVMPGGAVEAMTDPSVRLAPCSITHLSLDHSGGADTTSGLDDREGPVTVDGIPLRLGQFPAFDPARPWWYAESQADDPTVLTSDVPALRAVCLDYAAAVIAERATRADAAGGEQLGVVGLPVGPELRETFRSLLRSATEEGSTPTNPLDPGTAEAFFDWLRSADDAELTGISIAADIIWRARPDLAHVFPAVRWGDRDRFVQWLWTHGLTEGLITTAMLPPLPTSPGDPTATIATTAGADQLRFGVNLVGYHDSDLGLGVAVRRVAAALDAAGIPWAKVTYDRTHSRRRAGERTTSDAPYRFNLILIAPDQLQFFVDDVGPEFLRDHYNIGLWYWETDVLSERQRAAIDLVDEIWGSTKYLVDVFAADTDKPVQHVPVPLEFRQVAPDPTERQRLELDDRFTFLFTFDFFSIAQRKNPLGLVEAYRRAFEPEDGCRLVLKSINGARHLAEAEEIRARMADRPDMDLWDRYLDSSDRLALVANVDCYISLHRSEGLGLTMAEAMAAGTPVIATGYSGNVDFMGGGGGLLVDYTVVEIGAGSFYPAHGHWADPDLDHAATLMRRLHTEPALQAELRERGPKALRPFTLRRVGAAMTERLETLDRTHQ